MAELPHTLIIGDEIGAALYDALFTIPGTGAIWKDIWSRSGIDFWANGAEVKDALAQIAKGTNGQAPDRLPDTVVVSLGRQEILTEPDNVDPKALQALADDVGKFADQLKSLGLKVAWVLPPAVKQEGKVRATIESALAAKGVRVFPSQHSFVDPSTRGQSPTEIPKETMQRMADLLATWLPLGGPRGPIVPRYGEPTPEGPGGGGLVTGYGARIAAMSTPAKIGLGAAALIVLGGAAYYGYRRYG